MQTDEWYLTYQEMCMHAPIMLTVSTKWSAKIVSVLNAMIRGVFGVYMGMQRMSILLAFLRAAFTQLQAIDSDKIYVRISASQQSPCRLYTSKHPPFVQQYITGHDYSHYQL